MNEETQKNRAEENTQRTSPPSAHSRETADTMPARPSSQPAGSPKHTSAPVEVMPATASKKFSSNSSKGNPTMENTTAQVHSPQNAPAPQVQQAPWHSRAWDMIVNVARTMPRTNRENELRGACLQFCKKYPKITADYIEKVLSLHSKRTPEEQKRVVASVVEYIAGRNKQPLKESVQEKSGEGGTPKTENAHSQSQVAAVPKPEAATSQQTSRGCNVFCVNQFSYRR